MTLPHPPYAQQITVIFHLTDVVCARCLGTFLEDAIDQYRQENPPWPDLISGVAFAIPQGSPIQRDHHHKGIDLSPDDEEDDHDQQEQG